MGNWKSIYLSISVDSPSVTLVDMLLFLVSDCWLIESPFLETRAYELISMPFTVQTLRAITKLSSSFGRVNISASLLHRIFQLLMSYYELLMSQLHEIRSLFLRHQKRKSSNFISFCSSLGELMPFASPLPFFFSLRSLSQFNITLLLAQKQHELDWRPRSRDDFLFLFSFGSCSKNEANSHCCVYLATFQRFEWIIFVILLLGDVSMSADQDWKGRGGKAGDGREGTTNGSRRMMAMERHNAKRIFGSSHSRQWRNHFHSSPSSSLLSLIDFCRQECDEVSTSLLPTHSVNNKQKLTSSRLLCTMLQKALKREKNKRHVVRCCLLIPF